MVSFASSFRKPKSSFKSTVWRFRDHIAMKEGVQIEIENANKNANHIYVKPD